MGRRINGAYGNDAGANRRCISGRTGNGENGVCNGELLFAGIEDDVGPDGHGEDDDGGFVDLGAALDARLGVERYSGVPIVVEERVFVFLGFEGWQVSGEEGKMRGHGEESERVGEGRG